MRFLAFKLIGINIAVGCSSIISFRIQHLKVNWFDNYNDECKYSLRNNKLPMYKLSNA